jgi:hypothetical protein
MFVLTHVVACIVDAICQGSFVECTAPPPLLPSPSGNLTVLVRLLMLTPIAASEDLWRGIGGPAVIEVSGMAVTPLDITSVYVLGLVNSSAAINGTNNRLRRVTAYDDDWRAGVYGDKFMFTYTRAGELCGCDLNPMTTCDACGTCP